MTDVAEDGGGGEVKNKSADCTLKVVRVNRTRGEERGRNAGASSETLCKAGEEQKDSEALLEERKLKGPSASLPTENSVHQQMRNRRAGSAVTLLDMAGHPKYIKSSINGTDVELGEPATPWCTGVGDAL